MPETRPGGEPVCGACRHRHSTLFGRRGDVAACSVCDWSAAGVTARVWCLHHEAATGHACGLLVP